MSTLRQRLEIPCCLTQRTSRLLSHCTPPIKAKRSFFPLRLKSEITVNGIPLRDAEKSSATTSATLIDDNQAATRFLRNGLIARVMIPDVNGVWDQNITWCFATKRRTLKIFKSDLREKITRLKSCEPEFFWKTLQGFCNVSGNCAATLKHSGWCLQKKDSILISFFYVHRYLRADARREVRLKKAKCVGRDRIVINESNN